MRPPARVHRGAPGARLLPAALVVAALTRAACVPAATLVISIQSPDGHALAGAVVAARPLPREHLAPAHARDGSGPRARAHGRGRRPRGADRAPRQVAAAGADHRPSAFVGLLRRTMPKLPHRQALPPTLYRSAALITLLALCVTGRAADWELSLDTRPVSQDAGRAFMDGGLGATRYDRHDSGVQLGRARFA